MIAWLQGTLLEKQTPTVVINVNGVGYLVETSLTTFFKLPDIGQLLTIYIYQVVREDALLLYGFYDKAEREMFRLLIKINGVGPKLALGILSGIEAAQLAQCIALQDVSMLTKLPGIGKKTAERLVMEMQDKLGEWNTEHQAPANISSTSTKEVTSTAKPQSQDAISALIALGYKPPEAITAIKAVNHDAKSSEQLIRDALRYLSA